MLTEIASLIGIISGAAGIFISYKVFKAMQTLPQQLITNTIEEVKETFSPTVSKAFSQLSEKGVEAKEFKRLEQMVGEDIKEYAISQNPEIALMLGAIRGEATEILEEHPEYLLQLLTKYKPLIEQFAGQLTGNRERSQHISYDL